MGSYDIHTEKVGLSRDWGLSFNDYIYEDVDMTTHKIKRVQVDLQDLMVLVGARRAVVIEGEITPMSVRMRERNKYLSNLGGILAKLTKVQAEYSGDDSGSLTKNISLEDWEYDMLSKISNMIHKSGSGYYASKAEYEGLVQAVKSAMDKENNLAQTDMTRLQSLVDGRDDAYSVTTNNMSAISDTRSNLIQNL